MKSNSQSLPSDYMNDHLCQCGHEWTTMDKRKVSRHPCPAGGMLGGHRTVQIDSKWMKSA